MDDTDTVACTYVRYVIRGEWRCDKKYMIAVTFDLHWVVLQNLLTLTADPYPAFILTGIQLRLFTSMRIWIRPSSLVRFGYESVFWRGSGSSTSSKWWESATTGLQTLYGSIVSLPEPQGEPPRFPAFNRSEDTDPDSTSQNNADPHP